MTNEEDVIVNLKCIMNCLISEDLCSIKPIEKAINSIQENAKLKAEIEQLKAELEQNKINIQEPIYIKPTQADKIRSMSDEELAEELSNLAWDNEPTKEEVLKWLQSEVIE